MKLLENEKDPILLCYEDSDQFCHRHVLADYIELIYKIKVPEIEVSENLEITENERPEYIMDMLKETMKKYKDLDREDK